MEWQSHLCDIKILLLLTSFVILKYIHKHTHVSTAKLFFDKKLSYVSKLKTWIVTCEVKIGDVIWMFIVRNLDRQNDTLSVRS